MISKKWLTSSMMLLSVSLLVACSGNETIPGFKKSEDITTEVKSKTSQSKTSSPETTTSVTESTTTTKAAMSGMSIDAIIQGDFSGLEGRWENNLGQAIIFDAHGNVVYEDYSDTSNHINLNNATVKNGVLTAGITNPEAMVSATVPTLFVPAGISFSQIYEGVNDPSDVTKDRIFSTQAVPTEDMLNEGVYHRVVAE